LVIWFFLGFGFHKIRENMNAHEPALARGHAIHVLFHPDYTVGPGIAPDLLTPSG
jgi:hypothetical protein